MPTPHVPKDTHMTQSQKADEIYSCKECGVDFPSRLGLDGHKAKKPHVERI